MSKFKLNELDTHEWDIDKLPEIPTPILAECKICGLLLRSIATAIKPKQLDCSYCQKTIMVDIVISA